MAMTPADRARNYRKRKREEREALRALGRGPVTRSRTVTREAKRDKARADRVERAVAILEQPVPPRANLLDEALRCLRSVALDPGAAEASRVGAGRALVAWASGSQEGAPPGRSSSPTDVPPSSTDVPERAPTLDEALQ